MRQHRLQIGEQWQIDARSRELGGIESRSDDCFVPEGRAKLHISPWTGDHRAAGEKPSAFRADEMHECDENSMLRCDVAYETIPALERSRSGPFIRPRNNSARR